jgi:microfibrillar-associated protein 1
MPISKPLFVPKSKRGTVTELELQSQKHEEFEKRRAQDAEKRAIQSRALVAAAVSSSAGKTTLNSNEGDEFDTGEVGGEYIPVPDDTDPTQEDSPELVAAERNAWEVRELIRILRDVDEAMKREKERRELERRRALTDEERLEEDKLSGRYRAPGEARRRLRDDAQGSKRDGNNEESNRYLQRFHHRGAFYMDEDTLNQAGEDDVRHRAAKYSRAATGEDKIDKSALPKVMQVKKFGFAGYSTKYKGLAKEDTTDKKMDFLSIRGHAPARSSGHGRGGSGSER